MDFRIHYVDKTWLLSLNHMLALYKISTQVDLQTDMIFKIHVELYYYCVYYFLCCIGASHWLCVLVTEFKVEVMDSASKKLNQVTILQISKIVNTDKPFFKIERLPVQQQRGTTDCDLLAISGVARDMWLVGQGGCDWRTKRAENFVWVINIHERRGYTS